MQEFKKPDVKRALPGEDAPSVFGEEGGQDLKPPDISAVTEHADQIILDDFQQDMNPPVCPFCGQVHGMPSGPKSPEAALVAALADVARELEKAYGPPGGGKRKK